MGFDYLTGGPPNYRLFDTDGSETIDSDDTIVVGVEVGAALGGTTIIAGDASGGTGCRGVVSHQR